MGSLRIESLLALLLCQACASANGSSSPPSEPHQPAVTSNEPAASPAEEPLDPETAQLVLEAERELQLSPKRVRAARDVQYKYSGFTDSVRAALRGEAEPPPPSPARLAKAKEWEQRISTACQDPRTIECGHKIELSETGGLLDFVFTSWWPDATSAEQPFTITVHRDGVPWLDRAKSELSTTANTCHVSGLGFGPGLEQKVFTDRTASEWPALKRRYIELHGVPPSLFVECPIAITVPKPAPGIWMAKDGKIIVRGKSTRVAGIILQINPNSVVALANFPP
jgi:hypothetical protein